MNTSTTIMTPTIPTDLLGSPAMVTVTDGSTVSIRTDDTVTVNGIEYTLYATAHARGAGSWYADMHATRAGAYGTRPTDNASSKMYRAVVEIAESIPDEALLEGARVSLLREYQHLLVKQEALAAEMYTVRDRFIDLFHDSHIDDHCPTCTCNWSDAVTLDGFADIHCDSCTCHLVTFEEGQVSA